MEYEWERKIKKLLTKNGCDNLVLPENIVIRGVAVENEDTGEGALLVVGEVGSDVIDSDIWLDVKGDAECIYDQSIEGRRA
jgi:hypothetical protein